MGASASKGEVLPLQKGKTFVVTGANSGLGYIVARELCRAGGHVIVCARSNDKSATACASIQKELSAASPPAAPTAGATSVGILDGGSNGGKLEVGVIDLSSLETVKKFTSTLAKRPVDCLVNNAGVMNVPTRELSKDGFEMQFATNCLGHYALSVLLLPTLRLASAEPTLADAAADKSPLKPRIVNVSSIKAAEYWPPADPAIPVDFKRDPNPENPKVSTYDSGLVYNESKLVNLLVNNEMAKRCPDIMMVGAHPGVCSTNLFRYKFGWMKMAFQSADIGAKSIIWAAIAPEGTAADVSAAKESSAAAAAGAAPTPAAKDGFSHLKGVISGKSYFGPNGWSGGPLDLQMPKPAHDPVQMKRYWSALEEATGIRLEE